LELALAAAEAFQPSRCNAAYTSRLGARAGVSATTPTKPMMRLTPDKRFDAHPAGPSLMMSPPAGPRRSSTRLYFYVESGLLRRTEISLVEIPAERARLPSRKRGFSRERYPPPPTFQK